MGVFISISISAQRCKGQENVAVASLTEHYCYKEHTYIKCFSANTSCNKQSLVCFFLLSTGKLVIRESTSLWLLKNVTCCEQGSLGHICKCQKVKADLVCPWAFLFFRWTSFPVCSILLSLSGNELHMK